jgi:hypothetical protein
MQEVLRKEALKEPEEFGSYKLSKLTRQSFPPMTKTPEDKLLAANDNLSRKQKENIRIRSWEAKST